MHAADALTPAGKACHSPAARTMCCAALMRLDIRELPPSLDSMIDVVRLVANSDLTLRHLGTSSQPKNHITMAPSPTCSKATNMPSTASQPMPANPVSHRRPG